MNGKRLQTNNEQHKTYNMPGIITHLICFFFLVTKSAICLAQFPPKPDDKLLQGTIDFHVHSSPDIFDRSLSDIEVAQLAEKKGMRAIVIKNHVSSTVGRAVLVNSISTKIKIYGGIVLNKAVGGINPEAVSAMHRMSPEYGKVVWFPTFDAAFHKQIVKEAGEGISVISNGKLTEATLQVLQIIAKENLVMATGHLSPVEIIELVKEAKKVGIKHILITHAMTDEPGLTYDQMQQVVQMGAVLELTYLSYLSGANAPLAFLQKSTHISIDQMADVIKKLGSKNFILSSDLGQTGNATPPDGIKIFAGLLMEKGISLDDIRVMINKNPARLLGLTVTGN